MTKFYPGLAIAGLCLAICLQAPKAFAELAKPKFVKDGILTVCTSPNFPPMTYMENPSATRPIGIDIEIADALGKLWQAETRYSTSDFAGLLTSLASGRCGIMISGYYVSEERTSYDMTGYLQTSAVIVTAGQNAEIRTPDDLSGKSVTIEAGTTIYEDVVNALNETFAKQGRPLVKLSSYPTQPDAAQQVLLGRADATLSDLVEGSVRAKQTGNKLKIAYAYPPEHIFAIYAVKDIDNAAAIKAGLKQLWKDGDLRKIAAKYGISEAAFAVVDR